MTLALDQNDASNPSLGSTASASVSEANAVATARILACRPVAVGLQTAREALGLEEGCLGHAGPPFADPSEIPPTVANALAGAAVHEGWAGDLAAALAMLRGGEIRLFANHALGTVSPMAGVVRPSQPLMRIENSEGEGAAWATFAEQGRSSLRFGVYGETTAAGLRHVETIVAPAIEAALPAGGLAIWPLVDEGLRLGDDVHQRNIGGMAAFVAAMPGLPGDVRAWLVETPQHFLNYAMASAKLCLDRARGVPGSTVVTALSRNGVDCAIQVSGAGDRWFRAPSTIPQGGYFDGFSAADAQPDLGDSAIVEAFGLGGCAAHVSPEIARVMQADWREAQAEGWRQRAFFIARQSAFDPALATPEGLGAGLCAQRATAAPDGVRIHTGVSHHDGGQGWIGIGVARAPSACFAAAAAHVLETAA